ncbi:hypothetical protein [Bacillus toyonensis]|uniref:hypothetical protein n=1 Tax=Bacillus toyonensis TaxID=155322 RepID=UPI000BF7170A|nr:hypothetical protein [Bacillus toyonensis]PGF05057.1 hypothetical protein COM61_01075 [Bacillus toyonensis]
MSFQERVKAYKIPIIGVLVLLAVWFIFFRGSSSSGILTQQEFEDQLKEMSNGKIVISDSKIKMYENGDGGVYTANWNGFMITDRVDKNKKLDRTFGVMTKQAGYMDEISIGQYHDLVVYLTRLSNPKMSVDEANVLIDTGLNFNQQITTGEVHETSKGDLYYKLSGGKKEINFFSFLIMDEDGHKRVTNPNEK